MCGIVGIVSKNEFGINDTLLKSLKRLEYRGYDSSGYATNNGDCIKAIGEISNLIKKTDNNIKAKTAISHTRWATHGGVSELNAHPHFNSSKTVFAVHNGIIENYEEMKETLVNQGYKFITQTDTEVIPHFIDNELKKGKSMKEAVLEFSRKTKGTYAILIIQKGKDEIYALKKDSPLALGILSDGFILASDIYAFSQKTNKAIFFEDNEFAVVSAEKYAFFDGFGKEILKKLQTFEWVDEEEGKEEYSHYMIKEIYEQPKTSKRIIESLKTLQNDRLKRLASEVKQAKKIIFLSAGSSYHASLIGTYLLHKCGFDARTVIASEAENFLFFDKDSLVIPISQSGETMDVVCVLKDVKNKGAKIASIVNVPHSTIQRLSDFSIETLAGQEVCVAATKTFTNQLVVLFALAKELGYKVDLDKIPERIKKTITDNEEKVKSMALLLSSKKDIFVLGKGATYPLAREIALKLKEIDYIHAEGMMAGELKHGTIALIEKGTPVISLIPNHDFSMISSTKEVEARGAKAIIISNEKGDFVVPKSCEAEFSIYSAIVGHLLSYYIGVKLGLPIDKPRNLAKSCTVK
jgi:glutamine---fructose-6-phosphate transaminase (isomerizing)